MFDWLRGKKQDGGKPRRERGKPAPGDMSSPSTSSPSAGKDENGKTPPRDKQDVKIRTKGSEPAAPVSPEEEKLVADLENAMSECETIIGKPDFDLPMLPTAAVKVMQLLQDPDVPPKKIGDTVMTDQVLTAKFLTTANSPYYGGAVRIESVHQAVTRMGLTTVRNIVLTISLNSTILKEQRLGATARDLWAHSIGTAVVAQKLALLSKAPPATAFLAGLMHDIGKLPAFLLLCRCLPKGRQSSVRLAASLLERHHVRAGVALLSHWQLPPETALVVAAHHAVSNLKEADAQVMLHGRDVEDSKRQRLTRMLATVTMADRAMSAVGLADEPGDLSFIGSPLAADLGIPDEKAREFLAGVPELVKESAN